MLTWKELHAISELEGLENEMPKEFVPAINLAGLLGTNPVMSLSFILGLNIGDVEETMKLLIGSNSITEMGEYLYNNMETEKIVSSCSILMTAIDKPFPLKA